MSKRGLWDRISLALAGESERSFCTRANLKKTSLESVKRNQNPTISTLLAIAETANVSLDWLATGKEPMRVSDKEFQPVFSSSSINVPHYDIALSAGHGAFNEVENAIRSFPFPIDFIQKELQVADSSKLAIVDVRGDSMEPTIDDGELVMIDQSRQRFTDGIAALVYEDEAYIKRIQKGFGKLHIISDNPAYSKVTLSGTDLERVRIIGKVVWSGKRYD